MQHQPLEMRVLGRVPLRTDGAGSVDAWKVRETFRGMETTVWLDDAGRTLREQGPMDMVVQREDATRAVNVGWGDDAFDLMGAIAVQVRQPIPDPRHLARLDARLGGLGDVAVPTDGRQSFHDGVLHVEREPAAPPPMRCRTAAASGAASWRRRRSCRSTTRACAATAREILGGETDPRRAAERLRRWVYDELDKRPVASIPNALQVLDTRAGDCNEHAVLFAALARAVGLPARVVAGVVYADGAFLYHAWNEVWIGTGWLSVDPAFDQMPADATHVKLIEGGPETHAALVARDRQAVDRGAARADAGALTRDRPTRPAAAAPAARRPGGASERASRPRLRPRRTSPIGEYPTPEDADWLRAHAGDQRRRLPAGRRRPRPQGAVAARPASAPTRRTASPFTACPVPDGDADVAARPRSTTPSRWSPSCSARGERVYLHCNAGLNRAPTVGHRLPARAPRPCRSRRPARLVKARRPCVPYMRSWRRTTAIRRLTGRRPRAARYAGRLARRRVGDSLNSSQ